MAPSNAGTIELQVERADQLYHTLDPLPFRERDLDREAEEYIVSWARELPRQSPIRILIHIPAAEALREQARALGPAIQSYFRYRSEMATRDLKELFRIGRYSLAIGLAVLAACFAGGHLLASIRSIGQVGNLLNESLIILGWVANWRPIEIFLYDWWPVLRRRSLFQRLACAEIVLLPVERKAETAIGPDQ